MRVLELYLFINETAKVSGKPSLGLLNSYSSENYLYSLANVIITHHVRGLYGKWLDAEGSNHGLFLDIISTYLGGGRRIMNSHNQDSQFTGLDPHL